MPGAGGPAGSGGPEARAAAAARRRRLASVELAGLLLLGVAVLGIGEAPWLLALLAGVVAAAVLGGVPLRALVGQARAVLPLVGVVLLAHGLVTGWGHGLVVALRILVLVAAATAVTLSARTSDLLAVLAAACRPLRPLGIEPARVALVLAMTIRFVPLIAERLAAVREAQRARGVERPGPALLVPLLVGVLRLAGDLADALDARGADAVAPPPARAARG